MNKKNPIVKELNSNKYRQRVVPSKKKGYDETYDWIADWEEERNGKTSEDNRADEDVQSSDDS